MTQRLPSTLAIIDYGSGNLRSAAKAFQHVADEAGLACDVRITSRAEDVASADRIVLPGQGAFADCMEGLQKVPGMIEALEESVLRGGTPFFGICVGMQLLASYGHEFGTHAGLGWIPGDVVKMTPSDASLKIPHMGWNEMTPPDNFVHPVLQGVTKNAQGAWKDFYFVHSFVFQCKEERNIAGYCDYGGKFAAMVARDNIIGTQFHPEKSQQSGLDLIRGFLHWKP